MKWLKDSLPSLRLALVMLIVGAYCLGVIPFNGPQEVHAVPTTYYVSTSGNDSGPGSIDDPWLTIDNAVDSVSAGDTIYVRAGNYTEQVTITVTGTVGSPITLKNYPDEHVVIDGTGLSIPSTGLVYLLDVSYWVIDGFEIEAVANPSDIYNGVRIRRGSGTQTDITIKNSVIHDFASSGISASCSTDFTLQDVTIDGCEIYNTNSNEIHEQISIIAVDGFEVKNCYLHGTNPKEGIDSKPSLAGQPGSRNGSIHNNYVSGFEGVGIYVDSATNVTVYSNIVTAPYDVLDVGIAVNSEGGVSVSNVDVYNNLIIGCGDAMHLGGYSGTLTDIVIINNTVYIANIGGTQYSGFKLYGTEYSACVIRNNIITSVVGSSGHPGGVYAIVYGDYSSGEVTIDHNLFWNSGGGGWSDASSLWQTSPACSPIKSDPLFFNAGNNDFRLQATSPARNTGSSTNGPTTDYLGYARPQESYYDIGAYEYILGSQPPPSTTTTVTTITSTTGTTTNTITSTITSTIGTTTTTVAPPPPDGTPTLERMHVFRNLLETGDRLYVWMHDIKYSTKPDYNVHDAYIWQLIGSDNTTVLGYICGYPYHDDGYGYNVYSMYYDAADNVTWGTAYTLRLASNPGVFTSPVSYNYTISVDSYTTSTTQTDNQDELYDEVVYLGDYLDNKWELTGDSKLLLETETGTVLSLEGESFFRGAIYGLQGLCPQLFRFVVGDNLTFEDRSWSSNYTDLLQSQYNGTWIESANNASIGFFGTGYNLLGIIFVFGSCVALVIGNMALTADHWNGLIDCAFVLIIATRLGIVGLVITVLIMVIGIIYIGMRLFKMIPQ